MKIDFIKLKNFSNIYTVYNSREVSIDFRNFKNKIILMTGPNGSGKTSILSCLHPFATNGNLDVRNDNPLVLIGEEGYKEIWITDNENKYIIKHYYSPSKESHTVKSYIEKNGEEMNPNGNVTSFKELVRNELEIELDYLKLSRLGNNVTNFIDLKTTDRKAFMGKILDEVEIYLKYFKKITNDMRELKSIISHLVDKISKLGITDEDELESYQSKLKKKIEEVTTRLGDISSKLTVIDYEVNKYDPLLVVKESLDTKKRELDKMIKVLDKKDTNISVEVCEALIQELKLEIVSLNGIITSLKEKRNELLSNHDKMVRERDELRREITRIDNNADVTETKRMISELREKIDTRNKELSLVNYEQKYTKKDLEELVVMLDKCVDILYTTYEFGKHPIARACEYIVSGEDISTFVVSNKNKTDKNKIQSVCEFVYNTIIKKYKKETPKCSGCSYIDIINEIEDYATESPDLIVEDEVFVSYTNLAYQNIRSIQTTISNYADLIKKLPVEIQEMFRLDTILSNIENLKPLYDKSLLYKELSLVSDYELQESDLKHLEELKNKLELLEKASGKSDYMVVRLSRVEDELNSLFAEEARCSNELSLNENELVVKMRQLTEYEELLNSITNKDTVEDEYNELNRVYELIISLNKQKEEVSREYQMVAFELDKLTSEFNDNDYRIRSYKSFTEELTGYNRTYDEMDLVKNSLSSKSGIPLLYIQIYLKNIQEITNELLQVIYDGDLYIDNFNITADEFKIPFVTKNTTIKDVCYASQGEKSFISLAISFALMYQSISKYNIMLLDEIDATLDTENREKFLQILEKQMDMINAEQIFVISHNSMFDMYPVDVLNMRTSVNQEIQLS